MGWDNIHLFSYYAILVEIHLKINLDVDYGLVML